MSDNRPAEWRQVRLGDHATVKARLGWKGLKADEYILDGPIFLAAPNLRGGRIDFDNVDHVPLWRYDESPEIQLAQGDVLLVKDGSTLGMAGFVKTLSSPTTVNGSIALIRPRASLAGGFLYYSISAEHFQRLVWLRRSGLGVPHLFQADLRKFKISLPSLPEQNRVAEVLSTLDEAIQHTDALIEKYQHIRAGLVHDLFTRGVTPDGRLRPSRPEAPLLYKHSPLGWIPKEWHVGPVGAFIRAIDSGWSPNCLPDPASPGEWGVLKTTAVVWEGYRPEENKALPEGLPALPAAEVRKGDILITRKGPVDRVGVVAFVAATPPRLMFPDTVFRTTLIDDAPLGGAFMVKALGCQSVQKHWWQRKVGLADAQVNLNHGTVRNTPLPIPKLVEQEAILSLIHAAEETLEQTNLDGAKMRDVKRGLMHDLITGRVRLNVEKTAT